MTRFKNIFRKLLFTFIAITLICAVSEGLCRLIWSETDLHMNPELNFFTDHPTLFWVQKPNLDTTFREHYPLKTNSLGLRNEEVELPKPDNVYRILSLGESSTWGDRVESKQTYSKVLESILNKSPEGDQGSANRYEVINAGVGAYTIWQSYVFLKEKGIDLNPQMVIIYHQINDFLPSKIIDHHNYLYKVKYTDRELYERRLQIQGILNFLFKSRAYLAMRKLVLLLPSRLPKISLMDQKSQVRVPDKDRLAALKNMHKLCRENNIQFVIIQPLYKFANTNDRLLFDFAVARRVPYVNLPGMLSDAQTLGQEIFSQLDGVHPTAKGHALIAQAIAQKILPLVQK